MFTGPITITIADPGYDWTAWFMTGYFAAGVLLLGALLYFVIPRVSTSRYSARVSKNVGEATLVVGVVGLLVVVPMVGGAVGWGVHSRIVHSAKEAALEEEYGITDLERYDDSSMVSAVRDGELITGLMTETVPRTWVFQEMVAK